MVRPHYQDCVARAFEPLLKAAGRTDFAHRLKVMPPPKAARNEQFRKFGNLKSGGFPPLFLPNGGFFFPFFIEETQCYAFSSFLDDYDLIQALGGWIKLNDATIEFVDQASFLFLSYHASNFYTLRPEFQSRREADEIVALAEYDGYVGHDVDDLITYFRPTYIVSVPTDSVLSGIDPYVVATELLALVPALRSPIIDEYFAFSVHQLLKNPAIRSENLFLSLTATRWRYAYLELFRVIESTLHMPWLLDLCSAVPMTVDLAHLYASLRDKLEWREIKGRSLERVFDSIGPDGTFDALERATPAFRDLLTSSDAGRAAVARRIYKIRNQLVHPEDFTDGSLLNVTEEEFRALAIYLCAAADKIYEAYGVHFRARQPVHPFA